QFTGVERIVNTTADKGTGQVTAVSFQTCVTPPSTFSAPTPAGPPPAPSTFPWAIGNGNGSLGTDVVESFTPLTPSGSMLRLGVVSCPSPTPTLPCTGAGDALVTKAPGNPQPILLQLPFNPEVPTLGEWGLLLLALLLGGAAFWFLRRN